MCLHKGIIFPEDPFLTDNEEWISWSHNLTFALIEGFFRPNERMKGTQLFHYIPTFLRKPSIEQVPYWWTPILAATDSRSDPLTVMLFASSKLRQPLITCRRRTIEHLVRPPL